MKRLPLVVFLLAVGLLTATAAAAQTSPDRILTEAALLSLPEVAPPDINDPVSEAEMQDLRTLADQSGMSLQAAIDRYAWNDNFALAVAAIREAFPEAFTGAEIVDADRAWIGFAARAPEAARDMINAFGTTHGVSVDVHRNLGFTEVELQNAIETVHFAVLESPGVRDASTSYDFETGQITTTVVLESTVSDSVLDDLRATASRNLTDTAGTGILDSITISVVRSNRPVIGGNSAHNEHLGGEALSSCTSGFGTKTSTGVRGISTAGHCSDSQSDDGSSLMFKDDYEGTHGDFQWHTGPKTHSDDFYSGNSSSLEVNRRDVSSVGSPVVGQSLCENGKTTYKNCKDVRKVNVCWGGECNLVQLGTRSVQGGDSGGPVFWGNTAYGLLRGWHYDPFWPFSRDLFSRADRIDNALGIFIATS